MTDEQIKAELTAIDECESIDTNEYETNFIESLVYQWTRDYTEKQRATAIKIIDKYQGQY